MTARAACESAIAARNAQRMEDAMAAVTTAAALSPDDPTIAFMHAQIAFETGRECVALFDRALALSPDDALLVRNAAAALADSGALAEAEARLVARLALHPDWLDGHKSLCALRVTGGQGVGFDRSFTDACALMPHSLTLRLGWFHERAKARDWDGARAVIDDGESALGAHRAFVIARAYLAAESGAGADDEHLFDAIADLGDPGTDLAHVRHHLRGQRPERAEAIALRHVAGPSARSFWPYLSIIWRLTNDRRAHWLDGDPPIVGVFDLDITDAERAALASVLRTLHRTRAPFLDQSVRGGTQTSGQVLFHHDPIIQRARQKCAAAVRTYIDALPPADPTHPLLSQDRTSFGLAGSWSVLLNGQGHHASHTHPAGWISSAFYVSIPNTADAGPAPAGWIEFGVPPADLGLKLDPVLSVEPKAGRLVLFPSTTWHHTVPFAWGERLTIAFDIQP
jgi:hypothetical protein